MRGKRTLIAGSDVDLVLVSARYDSSNGQLEIARGYERLGAVWTDIKLYAREALVESLQSGLKVVTGRSAQLVGDFEVIASVRLDPETQTLTNEGSDSDVDDLGLPVF